MPEFKELLAYVADTDISLNVEIKDKTFEVVDQTVKTLFFFFLKDRFVIACFDANMF